MASSSPTLLLFVSAAVAALCLLATPASAGGRALHEFFITEDACRTSSFPDVCKAMLGTGGYKSEADVTLAMLGQSQAHTNQALANVAGLLARGGTTAKQAEALRTCKERYGQAAMDLEEAVKYFHMTPEITLAQGGKKAEEAELWHRYAQHLLQAAKDVYECAEAVEGSGEPAAPSLAETSRNLVRLMYTSYDLCTRTQEGI